MIEIQESREGRSGRAYRLRSTTEAGAHGNFEWTMHYPDNEVRDPLALDLLEIGKAVHMADRMFRRSFRLGQRTRQLMVRVLVREPSAWNAQRPLLEQLANFATADVWRLEFSRWSGRSSKSPPRKVSPRSVVALFSGGLDSLCGAARLAPSQETPFFVSHSPPGWENNLELIRGVWEAFGKELVPAERCAMFRLEVRERNRRGRRSLFQEHSRRSRPFFFLALACAVAIDQGIPAVQMSENGALGLSLPIRADAYGAMCSRQAHGFLLRGFASLLDAVRPCTGGWRVFNPFEDLTKGEACQFLKAAAPLAKDAISCEYVGRQAASLRFWMKHHPAAASRMGRGPQCGLCLPCLIRRAALHRASIPDPDKLYFFDARRVIDWKKQWPRAYFGFGRKVDPPIFRAAAEHVFFVRRFCEQALHSDPMEFSMQYLSELRFSLAPQSDTNQKLRSWHKLVRRLAKEMIEFLDVKQ